MDDTMPDRTGDHTPDTLRSLIENALEGAWVDHGYTAPNNDVYPWLWLWDSCFHSVVWAQLDRSDRALTELGSVLSLQDSTGFVPHMGYQLDPPKSLDLWGRLGSSSITQPPMYGHALAEMTRCGISVPAGLFEKAAAGLRFLLEQRKRTTDGLITVVHPWETGCDDSPRWDDLCPGDGFDPTLWRKQKMSLLDSIQRGSSGEPLANSEFSVGSIGFNSLVAWNAMELVELGVADLGESVAELVEALEARWDRDLGSWVDSGANAAGSGRVRTADSLLPLLVSTDESHRAVAAHSLVDKTAHGSTHGPLGVHRGEPSFDSDKYWRGPVWPQLAYLLWRALDGSGSASESGWADEIARSTVSGAEISGLAEYWNGDSGLGLGAVPQSWTGLALLMRKRDEPRRIRR